MNLYLENGYLNIPGIVSWCKSQNIWFLYVVGGRATGKTYGALQMAIDEQQKFMYMRQRQTQIELITLDEFNPFKTLNRDRGWNIHAIRRNKYTRGWYHCVDEDGKAVPEGNQLGVSAALSTMANLRGLDASDITLFIDDEFIPQEEEIKVKNAAQATFNAYETFNRNREFNGEDPIFFMALSNSNTLENDLFIELNLVTIAERLKRQGREWYYDKKKGVAMIILKESPISKRKGDTALYRMTEGTRFSQMSLDNEFAKDEQVRIGSQPLIEYRPIATVDVGTRSGITVYKHKSRDDYYVCRICVGSPPAYTGDKFGLKRFSLDCSYLVKAYYQNNIIFENYISKILLTRALGI